MMRSAVLLLLAMAAPAGAQADNASRERTIQVMGRGKVSSPPNTAVIDYWIAGEGKTPDAASSALADKQRAVVGGMSSLLGGRTMLTGGNVVVIEARSPECRGPNSYGAQPQLSEGACAPTGYLATLQGNIRTDAINKAGTAVGLAVRLGARDARLQQFLLSDDGEAQRRAVGNALADARTRAMAMAAGSGARLGPVISIRDQNSGAQDVVVTGSLASAPPAPPAPPPVEIDVAPRPIETQAQVYVTYAILP